jgi:uncharacterized membrane protein YraQ (UPF0718 family)
MKPQQEKKNLLVFGYGVGILLTIFSNHWAKHHGWGTINWVFLVIAFGLVIVTFLNYLAIKPFYKQWMKVAHAIGTVITTLILTVLYYCVFGIAGIMLRLLRKDLLDRRLDPKASTYWIARPQKSFDQVSYTKQY